MTKKFIASKRKIVSTRYESTGIFIQIGMFPYIVYMDEDYTTYSSFYFTICNAYDNSLV